MNQIDPKRVEALGPAERTVRALTQFTDHLYHGRCGVVNKDGRTNIGVRWVQATWRKQEDGSKHVFKCEKVAKKTVETLLGTLDADGKTVRSGNAVVAEYRQPGLFPEVAVWMYQQVADVFRTDNEFAAKWASWAFEQDREDLKVILAAFMLVQDRRGDPHVEDGKILFRDVDYRDVGEAMVLIRKKGAELSPKQIKLIGEVLKVPGVVAINRALGFSKSAKNPQLRRYKKAVHKWLLYRENNPRMLAGLTKAGWGKTVRTLAQTTQYKPASENFFRILRWEQEQAKTGHRTLALNMVFDAAETWADLDEATICERIVTTRPGWKVITGRLPAKVGLTRAIVAAAVEAGALSDKDLVILTPTLEELGLLSVEPVASAWKRAAQNAEDQRAANIARNVKSDKAKEVLQEAADAATAKAIAKVTKNLRTYFIVDKSGSMSGAIEATKRCLAKFLGGFPLDRTHVAVFNTIGSEIKIQSPHAAAVEQAFRGHAADGGTVYGQGVRALQHHKPKAEEDVLFIFVGDDEGEGGTTLAAAVTASGLNPVAFARLYIKGTSSSGHGRTVLDGANVLGIPCLQIDETLFDDPYAVTHTLTNLIASTPVGARPAAAAPVVPRVTLVEQILAVPLLAKPAWAL